MKKLTDLLLDSSASLSVLVDHADDLVLSERVESVLKMVKQDIDRAFVMAKTLEQHGKN